MYFFRTALLLLVACLVSAAQTSSQHGIQTADLDTKAAPCTDFAQYANGAWHAQNPIPAYMDRWSRRWQAGEFAKDQLKDILEEVSKRTDWPQGSTEQLIGDFYGSCMDEAKINKAGLAPAQPLLKDIDAMRTPADLQRMILRLQELSVFVPFGIFASPDNHNPGQTIANVFANGLGLPDRDYYLKTEQRFQDAREKYVAHVTNMFRLAGYDEAKAKGAAKTVFEVEKKLAENSLDNVALRDPQNTDHKTSYAELKKLAPAMDWDGFFAAAGISHADLNVSEPKFMQEVNRQLRQTSMADWKTYLKWQLLHSAADGLSDPFVNENFAFYGKYLSGQTEIKPRWKRCAELTDQMLGEASGKKYVEKYFPPAAKARAQEMVTNILAAMRDTIEGLDWMGPETKKRALDKLSTFNPKIGYPDKWKDYSTIKLDRASFWDNQVSAVRWNVRDDNWARIGRPTDRGRWGMTPPTSNAYYNALMNEIVFPAGILQPPAFDMNAVDAVNYGSIGVVIGHEISHGFDEEGA
ncbi:MAG TPA: M13 family metallopeptidase, partial [Terriglobales bacterium]|nr:M13 family metallopeptidase [Terriglobales bacterium]